MEFKLYTFNVSYIKKNCIRIRNRFNLFKDFFVVVVDILNLFCFIIYLNEKKNIIIDVHLKIHLNIIMLNIVVLEKLYVNNGLLIRMNNVNVYHVKSKSLN